MFTQWIERIKLAQQSAGTAVGNNHSQDDFARVSAALLVEVARADHQLEASEVSSITKALQQSSSLENSEVSDIVNSAVVDADSAISLHEHIKLVNEQFDHEQKYLLIEQMWRVAAADGNIDHYEDYTIRKTSELLYVRHSEFIKAKLRVIGN